MLLDIVMPEMDGFEVLAAMNQNHWIEDIPVIMISSEDSDSYIRRAYEMGVSDYISRPFDAKIVYQRVLNMIKLYAKQRRLIRLVTRQIYEKERNNRMLIGILSQIVEFRNGESGRHVIHINLITQLLLEQLVKKTGKYQLSWEERLLIATASALHDIGKVGIDEKILNKPGKLTKEEFEIMKTHTLIGAQMLDNLDMYRNEKLLKLAYRQEIAEFYDMTVALWSYGNDDFQKQMFGGYPDEETQMQAHTAFADDRRNLRIETTDGLRFFISFHPSFDWINGGGTMSYFKIDEQMHAWIDRNLN